MRYLVWILRARIAAVTACVCCALTQGCRVSFAAYLKEVGRGERGARDLPFDEAKKLFGAMLDGGVPDLELGALLIALRFKTESLTELLGFYTALDERIAQLKAPAAAGGIPGGARLRPVIIPSYNGARRQANLMPLLVMLLKRLQIPVLVHGVLAPLDLPLALGRLITNVWA